MKYTPGHTATSVAFMARRHAATHAAFLLPHLRTGMDLLDCGCGPGIMTVDLARIVRPGNTVGFDRNVEQSGESVQTAREEGLPLSFEDGDVSALPFDDASFDVVFAHALMEHLPDPQRAVREFARVLRPDGILALRSPDWGGFILYPYPADLSDAIRRYRDLMVSNSGDPLAGRKLAAFQRDAGLCDVRSSASYEIYDDPENIAEYLAKQLDPIDSASAKTLRAWHHARDAFFAQAWIESIGHKTGS